MRRALRDADPNRVELWFWIIVIVLAVIFSTAFLLTDYSSSARQDSTQRRAAQYQSLSPRG